MIFKNEKDKTRLGSSKGEANSLSIECMESFSEATIDPFEIDDDYTEDVDFDDDSAFEVDYGSKYPSMNRLLSLILMWVGVALFVYITGVIWLNLVVLNGYPTEAIEMGLNNYVTEVWTFQYFMVYIPVLNLLPAIFLGLMGASRKDSTSRIFMKVFAILALAANILSVAYFLGVLVFKTNTVNSARFISNDYRYCHEFYESVPTICPNVDPFDPVPGELKINNEFKQLLIFYSIEAALSVVYLVISGEFK